jgi:hypothetical protein
VPSAFCSSQFRHPKSKKPAVTLRGSYGWLCWKPFAAFSSSSHQHHGTQNMLRPRPAPPEEEAVSKSEEIDSSVAHDDLTKHSLQIEAESNIRRCAKNCQALFAWRAMKTFYRQLKRIYQLRRI